MTQLDYICKLTTKIENLLAEFQQGEVDIIVTRIDRRCYDLVSIVPAVLAPNVREKVNELKKFLNEEGWDET